MADAGIKSVHSNGRSNIGKITGTTTSGSSGSGSASTTPQNGSAPSSFAVASGSPLSQSQLTNIFTQGLQMDGQPVNSQTLNELAFIAQHESSDNPNAVDQQPVNGENATGLFQTLPSTFQANEAKSTSASVNGSNNIYDPVANTAAAINYMIARYGSVDAAYQYWLAHGNY